MTDRPAIYFARIDAHLPTLGGRAARRSFLAQQLAGWEFRYERWQLTDGKSEPCADHGDPPQASDFLLVITGLAARCAILMPPRNSHVAEPFHGIVNAISPKVPA